MKRKKRTLQYNKSFERGHLKKKKTASGKRTQQYLLISTSLEVPNGRGSGGVGARGRFTKRLEVVI